MPTEQHRAEQQASPPSSMAGLAWPSSGDEPSGAEQSPAAAATDPKRAEQSQSRPISRKSDLPDEYLDFSGGGWIPPRALIDLCADGEIQAPSETAAGMVAWTTEERGPAAAYQLLLATAITILEREIARQGSGYGASAIEHLVEAGRDGVLALIGAAERPNEARPFA